MLGVADIGSRRSNARLGGPSPGSSAHRSCCPALRPLGWGRHSGPHAVAHSLHAHEPPRAEGLEIDTKQARPCLMRSQGIAACWGQGVCPVADPPAAPACQCFGRHSRADVAALQTVGGSARMCRDSTAATLAVMAGHAVQVSPKLPTHSAPRCSCSGVDRHTGHTQ